MISVLSVSNCKYFTDKGRHNKPHDRFALQQLLFLFYQRRFKTIANISTFVYGQEKK
jgi:hypothetical protein